jgi:hypothetical protein
MNVRTHVKAGKMALNRCETSGGENTPVRRWAKPAAGRATFPRKEKSTMNIKTHVKAGRIALNRCETFRR